MLANQVTTELNPDAVVFEMLGRMEALAADSAWDQTERLAVRLKSAVLDVPENARERVLVAVSQRLERVQTLALASRCDVTEKLSEIRRGRVATRAYGQPQGKRDAAILR